MYPGTAWNSRRVLGEGGERLAVVSAVGLGLETGGTASVGREQVVCGGKLNFRTTAWTVMPGCCAGQGAFALGGGSRSE